MRLQGRVWKDGSVWLAEVPMLDAMTQGRTRKNAFRMVEDWVKTMINTKGFEATVYPIGKGSFEVGGNDIAALVALMLRRMRELHGISLSKAAQRMGASSKNAYARYERGTAVPTVTKLFELLAAVAPGENFTLAGHPKAA